MAARFPEDLLPETFVGGASDYDSSSDDTTLRQIYFREKKFTKTKTQKTNGENLTYITQETDDDDDYNDDDEYDDPFYTVSKYPKINSMLKSSVLKSVKLNPSKCDKYAIRKKIHEFWLDRDVPRLSKVLMALNADKNLPNFSWQTLYRCLKDMDFEYSERGSNCAILEKWELINARRKYLRAIKKYREEGRPIYYLDEMMVKVEKDVSNSMMLNETDESNRETLFKNSSAANTNKNYRYKGKRLVVCHVASINGFVPRRLMSFEYKKHSRKFHDEMNTECFSDWLEAMLPKLDKNAVIVMDDAPYHLAKQTESPTEAWKKAEVISWLESRGEVIDKSMIFAELMEIVNRILPFHEKYVADELALQHEKIVLRLPHFHTDLNPIRSALSNVKNYVDLNNKTYNMTDVRRLLVEGIESISVDMWKEYISDVVKKEEKYWKMDDIIDELLDVYNPPMLSIIKNYDSDSSSASSDIFE